MAFDEKFPRPPLQEILFSHQPLHQVLHQEEHGFEVQVVGDAGVKQPVGLGGEAFLGLGVPEQQQQGHLGQRQEGRLESASSPTATSSPPVGPPALSARRPGRQNGPPAPVPVGPGSWSWTPNWAGCYRRSTGPPPALALGSDVIVKQDGVPGIGVRPRRIAQLIFEDLEAVAEIRQGK